MKKERRPMKKIKVFLDPGHGGEDRSNRGPTGYVEADGMLDVCLKLRDELLSTGAFEVKLSRDKDMTVGVRERGKMAAEWGADMFISEHSNATGWSINNSARGVEVFYSVKIPSDKSLAEKFSKAIAEAMGTQNRGAKTWESEKYPGQDYLGVINASQAGGVKHVFLIENGFHDHKLDEAILKDSNKRLAIAKATAKVICDFYGVLYPKDVELENALKILSEKKVPGINDVIINTPEYWKGVFEKKEVNFEWLRALIIKTSKYLEKI